MKAQHRIKSRRGPLPEPTELNPRGTSVHGMPCIRLQAAGMDPAWRYVVERWHPPSHWARVWLLDEGATSLDRNLYLDPTRPRQLTRLRLRPLNPTEEPS